ncbi:MAG: DUF190 domain-containing protein [Gemmatimonadota bacterium]|nr:DUF190 domain-containing protein [Gemmatimonadota bacterium]MDH5805153.1 DUF190 domain-containing protein [Gemmatimonadota bacterium]
MTTRTDGRLLRIYVGEASRYEGKPLYEWIVHQAREHSTAGATVLRGIEGYGANSQIHTANILRLSADLPIVVEIVDQEEKIEQLLDHIEPAIAEGLATLEKVEIRWYRSDAFTD